jgi:hypothetical protein
MTHNHRNFEGVSSPNIKVKVGQAEYPVLTATHEKISNLRGKIQILQTLNSKPEYKIISGSGYSIDNSSLKIDIKDITDAFQIIGKIKETCSATNIHIQIKVNMDKYHNNLPVVNCTFENEYHQIKDDDIAMTPLLFKIGDEYISIDSITTVVNQMTSKNFVLNLLVNVTGTNKVTNEQIIKSILATGIKLNFIAQIHY